jgi:membrane protein implicated in regulation of membrane protease activity
MTKKGYFLFFIVFVIVFVLAQMFVFNKPFTIHLLMFSLIAGAVSSVLFHILVKGLKSRQDKA